MTGMTGPRPSAAIEQMRSLGKTLRDITDEPNGAELRKADGDVLAAVVQALGFALADWLRSVTVNESGQSYNARLRPEYVNELADKATDLAKTARRYAPPKMGRFDR